MIGGIIHNYTLPPTWFQFFIIPLYATGSKQLNGIGKLSYSFYPGKNGQKFQAAISGSRFSGGDFTEDSGEKNTLPFNKIVPNIGIYVSCQGSPKYGKKTYFLEDLPDQ
jgi:hypothetical protein